ncbi:MULTISPECIES: hypothetical protein [unclassified Caulobacter]|uniref:hypothetical protein n=1 Tax=unclassified Caulobacter TaxID=2648921 RepID=UPI000FDCC6A0|nr:MULTISPECIES: hypothetical protein [unclassified Caulobacter]AZS23417.1 hypothetical protein CSW63_11885 [Caulobacter sp. FWC26]
MRGGQRHTQARGVAAHERDEEAAQLEEANRVDITRHPRQRDRQRHLAASVVLHVPTPAQKKTAGSSPIRPPLVIRKVASD